MYVDVFRLLGFFEGSGIIHTAQKFKHLCVGYLDPLGAARRHVTSRTPNLKIPAAYFPTPFRVAMVRSLGAENLGVQGLESKVWASDGCWICSFEVVGHRVQGFRCGLDRGFWSLWPTIPELMSQKPREVGLQRMAPTPKKKHDHGHDTSCPCIRLATQLPLKM